MQAIANLGPEIKTRLVTDRQLDKDEVSTVLKVLQDEQNIAELLRQGLVQPEQLKNESYVSLAMLCLLNFVQIVRLFNESTSNANQVVEVSAAAAEFSSLAVLRHTAIPPRETSVTGSRSQMAQRKPAVNNRRQRSMHNRSKCCRRLELHTQNSLGPRQN